MSLNACWIFVQQIVPYTVIPFKLQRKHELDTGVKYLKPLRFIPEHFQIYHWSSVFGYGNRVFSGFYKRFFFRKKRGGELGGRLPELWPQPLKSFYVSLIKTSIPPEFDDLLQKRQLESQDDLYWEDIEHVWRHLDFFFFYWSFPLLFQCSPSLPVIQSGTRRLVTPDPYKIGPCT